MIDQFRGSSLYRVTREQIIQGVQGVDYTRCPGSSLYDQGVDYTRCPGVQFIQGDQGVDYTGCPKNSLFRVSQEQVGLEEEEEGGISQLDKYRNSGHIDKRRRYIMICAVLSNQDQFGFLTMATMIVRLMYIMV